MFVTQTYGLGRPDHILHHLPVFVEMDHYVSVTLRPLPQTLPLFEGSESKVTVEVEVSGGVQLFEEGLVDESALIQLLFAGQDGGQHYFMGGKHFHVIGAIMPLYDHEVIFDDQVFGRDVFERHKLTGRCP